MYEVAPNLHVGNETDFESTVKEHSDWPVIRICADGSNDPSGCLVRQGDKLSLVLADAQDPAGIPKELVDAALLFIGEHLPSGQDVLVCSRQGSSRAAGIALLYLAVSRQLPCESLEAAEAAFRDLYPPYAPATGMRGFLVQNWSSYINATPSPLAHERLF